jgi:flagellar basal-body rod protein FlgB
MRIFDATLARLERSLDIRLTRHNVLSGNLANIDTPGYRPKDIDFRAAMASLSGAEGSAPTSLQETDERHLPVGGGAGGSTGDVALTEASGSSPTLDGNRVDLDRTMAQMAANGMQYGASARSAAKKLAILRYVVNDGNG